MRLRLVEFRLRFAASTVFSRRIAVNVPRRQVQARPHFGGAFSRFSLSSLPHCWPLLDMETVDILGFRAKVARTFRERARGLIGTKSLAPGEGLLIEKCNAIHTFFMSFPIDAYFLDDRNRVIKTVKMIRPWSFLVWGGWRAKKVLEVAACPDSKNSSGPC